jgi:hypothetical protein
VDCCYCLVRVVSAEWMIDSFGGQENMRNRGGITSSLFECVLERCFEGQRQTESVSNGW